MIHSAENKNDGCDYFSGKINSGESLKPDRESPWLEELGRCLIAIQAWKNPFNETRIFSAIGRPITSHRVLPITLRVKAKRNFMNISSVPLGSMDSVY